MSKSRCFRVSSISILILLLILLWTPNILSSVQADYVEPAKSGIGTIIVSSGSNITIHGLTIDIWNGANYSSVDPWTLYTFNVSVLNNSQLGMVKNVTISLTSSSGQPGKFNITSSYAYQWDNTTGTIIVRELTAGGWSTSLTYLGNVFGPTGSIYPRWTFYAKLARTVHNESTWKFSATIKDVFGQVAMKQIRFSVNKYIGFSIPSSINWNVITGMVNQEAASMPAFVTVTSNSIVKIQIRGGGNITGPSISLPLESIRVNTNHDTFGSIPLTTSYQDLYTSLSSPNGTTYPTYWFVTIPFRAPLGHTYSLITSKSHSMRYSLITIGKRMLK